VELVHRQRHKETISWTRLLRTEFNWCWMGSTLNLYPCDLGLLYWFLSSNIFLVRDFCWLRWWHLRHWHLGVDICLTSAGCHLTWLPLKLGHKN
jgi:hypothetical protein